MNSIVLEVPAGMLFAGPAIDVWASISRRRGDATLEQMDRGGNPTLTPRELQVARLITGGRSNKEIAAALVISQRTVENHVEHILTKLGFTSRAQVAAWVAASQPDGDGRLAAPGVQTPVV